jgi:hypothetical protein
MLVVCSMWSCRALTVCREGCPDVNGSRSDDGGAGGLPDSDDDRSPTPTRCSPTPNFGGQPGVFEPSMVSGAGGELTEGGTGNACLAPRAECDGAAETACETNVDWASRHCGGCDRRCDGVCSGGVCGAEQALLEESSAVAFVAGDPYNYVLTSHSELVRIARGTAVVTSLATGLGDGSAPDALALGDGVMYVWTRGSGQAVERIPMDGAPRNREDFLVDSFGASKTGAYWVVDEALWFRPLPTTTPKLLASSARRVVCSSPSLVVIEAGAPPELYEARGEVLVGWGPSPPGLEEPICGEGRLVFLKRAASGLEVHYVSEAGRSATAVSDVAEPVGPPVVWTEGLVSLTLKESGNIYVRSLNFRTEDSRSRAGLPPTSVLVHRDTEYVWYNSFNNAYLTPRFKRAYQAFYAD